MARDLEEFLRKAAERRASRQTNARPPQAPVAPPEPVVAPVESVRPQTFKGAYVSSEAHGGSVDQADDRMSRRLKNTFEHAIGAIAPPTTSATAEVSAETMITATAVQGGAIDQVISLLSRSDSAAQAILLREILERPEHRW